MIIGMFTCGYQRNTLEEAFFDAKRFGYDYIELWGGRPHAYPQDILRDDAHEIRKLIDQYEMPVLGYTPEINAYPYNLMWGEKEARSESLEHVRLSMSAAKLIGAQFTLISAGHAGYGIEPDKAWDRLVQSLRELSDYAEQIKHTIVFETLTPYESNVATTAEDLRQLLDAVQSDYVSGMCDVVPPFVQGEKVADYVTKLGGRMRHMHLADNDGCSDTHLAPGQGSMPLADILRDVHAAGYNGSVTIELVTNYLDEPRLWSKRSIDAVRAMLP